MTVTPRTLRRVAELLNEYADIERDSNAYKCADGTYEWEPTPVGHAEKRRHDELRRLAAELVK